MSKPATRPVRGFALSIAPFRPGWRPIAQYVDASPVLIPESAIANDNGRRRFRFIEQIGAQPSPRQSRSVGDVFLIDRETAEFVREAINEKLIRDQETEINKNAFQIFGSTITKIDGDTVLKLAAERLGDGQTVTFDIILESPKAQRQEKGQKAFSQLCRCIDTREIEDAEKLHGRKASYQNIDGLPVFHRAPAVKSAA